MVGPGPLLASSQMGHLWDALDTASEALAPLDTAAGRDEVFRQLVLARITEPTSRQDGLRVLAEVGVEAASYPTLNRRLPGYAAATWRQELAAACAAHAALGPTSLVMFDVSTPGRRSFGIRRSRTAEPAPTRPLAPRHARTRHEDHKRR